MHALVSNGQRRWPRFLIALGLSAIVIGLSFSFGSSRPASADSGCNSNEAVACIPLPPAVNPGGPCLSPSGTLCGTGASVAAPVPSIPCPVYGDPYGPPIPAGCCQPEPAVSGGAMPASPAVPVPSSGCCAPTPVEGPGAQAAVPSVPVPAPYFCPPFRGIYATINLGNAADVHALRTLSTDGLSSYWSGDALSMLQGQVADLENRGVYATARLYSIQVQDASFSGPGAAVVHTMEHWLYQERSLYDGSVTYSQDQWVANEYDLSFSDGAWTITYNNATLQNGS